MVSSPRHRDALAEAARRWGRRPALTAGGRTLTYTGLDQMVRAAAEGYRALGLGRDELVACQFPNGIEHLVAACAAWRLGAVYAPLDRNLTRSDLLRAIDETGGAALIRPRAGDGLVVGLGSGRKSVRSNPQPCWGRTAFAPYSPEESPADLLPIAQEIGRIGEFTPSDVHLAYLPLSTCVGLSLALAALLTGGRLVLHERFSVDAMAGAIETQGITVIAGSPEHLRALEGSRLDRVRVAVAALHPFPIETLRSLLVGAQRGVLAVYCPGSGLMLGTADQAEILTGSVGRPLAGSVAILDPRDGCLSDGEPGEIAVIRGDHSVRRTGDLGWLDGDNHLHVIGRRHRQIIRVGQRIDPAPIESALRRCPEVRDAAVIGVPNQVLGQAVCACVVPGGSHGPTLGGLWPTLGARLPDQLCLTPAIPRTQVGEVDVGCLRAYVLESPCESAPFRYS